jgi:hypothetical protein
MTIRFDAARRLAEIILTDSTIMAHVSGDEQKQAREEMLSRLSNNR